LVLDFLRMDTALHLEVGLWMKLLGLEDRLEHEGLHLGVTVILSLTFLPLGCDGKLFMCGVMASFRRQSESKRKYL
jgi:hypothetical protein